jgi:hypothetical protein
LPRFIYRDPDAIVVEQTLEELVYFGLGSEQVLNEAALRGIYPPKCGPLVNAYDEPIQGFPRDERPHGHDARGAHDRRGGDKRAQAEKQ